MNNTDEPTQAELLAAINGLRGDVTALSDKVDARTTPSNTEIVTTFEKGFKVIQANIEELNTKLDKLLA